MLVKCFLRKYGYPPDKQEKATQTVLEQAALLSAGWAAAGTGHFTTHTADVIPRC
jgi:type I restriction enzyme R subunit